MFTAPLPLKEREENGFRGPRENAPCWPDTAVLQELHDPWQHRLYLRRANAVFDRCRIEPWHHATGTSLYHSPQHARRQARLPVCELYRTGQRRAPAASILGRPWRLTRPRYWLDCVLSDEVCTERHRTTGVTGNEKTARFGQYGSTGPGSAAARLRQRGQRRRGQRPAQTAGPRPRGVWFGYGPQIPHKRQVTWRQHSHKIHSNNKRQAVSGLPLIVPPHRKSGCRRSPV